MFVARVVTSSTCGCGIVAGEFMAAVLMIWFAAKGAVWTTVTPGEDSEGGVREESTRYSAKPTGTQAAKASGSLRFLAVRWRRNSTCIRSKRTARNAV